MTMTAMAKNDKRQTHQSNNAREREEDDGDGDGQQTTSWIMTEHDDR